MSDAKGNGPPADIAASDLWLMLSSIQKPHRVVDFPMNLPGSEEPVGQVALVPLSMEETMVCKSSAAEQAKKMTERVPSKPGEESAAYFNVFTDEAAVQILWKAMRVPGDIKKPAFPTPTHVRKHLTSDAISVLMGMYNRVVIECGPIVAYMSKEEMNAWVDRLGEGAGQFPLERLTLEAQRDLLMHSMSELRKFRMANGSAGSPLASGSTTSEQTPPSDAIEVAAIDEIEVPPADQIG